MYTELTLWSCAGFPPNPIWAIPHLGLLDRIHSHIGYKAGESRERGQSERRDPGASHTHIESSIPDHYNGDTRALILDHYNGDSRALILDHYNGDTRALILDHYNGDTRALILDHYSGYIRASFQTITVAR
jgi:hypothetical protein